MSFCVLQCALFCWGDPVASVFMCCGGYARSFMGVWGRSFLWSGIQINARIKGFTAELCTVARLSVLITSATGRVNAKRQLCPFGYSRSSFHPGGGLAAWFQISAVSLLKCPLARHYIYPKLFPMLCHQCFNVWMISHTTLPPLYECVVSDLRRLERLL